MRWSAIAVLMLVSACDTDRPAPTTNAPSASSTATSAAPASAATATPDTNIAYARSLIGKFGPALKQELMQGMSAGGAVNAVDVCSEKAPNIANTIDVQAGWTIGRTSLKLRNPKNAPDAWEQKMLAKLESDKASGTPVAELEVSETVDGEFRYLKAIGTEAMCLTCHGSDLPTDLTAALDAKYPKDAARGYGVGDIRGAFTIRRQVKP